MSNHGITQTASSSNVALVCLDLAGYPTIERAHADDCIFVCIECGSTMYATTTPSHSREQQQAALAENFLIACCGEENLFLV